jgi:hypothetical protein
LERTFATHQGRLPQELAFMRIRMLDAANRPLRETWLAKNRDRIVKVLKKMQTEA